MGWDKEDKKWQVGGTGADGKEEGSKAEEGGEVGEEGGMPKPAVNNDGSGT